MWTWIANKCAKFIEKRLNRIEIWKYSKKFQGATFLKHPVYLYAVQVNNSNKMSFVVSMVVKISSGSQILECSPNPANFGPKSCFSMLLVLPKSKLRTKLKSLDSTYGCRNK